MIVLTGLDYFRYENQYFDLDQLTTKVSLNLGEALLGVIRYTSPTWKPDFLDILNSEFKK